MKTPFVRAWVWLFLFCMMALLAGVFLYVDQVLPKEDRFFSDDPAAWGSFGRLFFHFLSQPLLQLLLIAGFLVLSIVAHECAHAGVGWLLGLRVFAIQIGTGSLLGATYWRGVRIELRLAMWSGLVRQSCVSPAYYRTRMFLAILAAPLLNAALLGIALANIHEPSFITAMSPIRPVNFFAALAFANVCILAGCLSPHSGQLEDELLASDGLLLFQIPFWTKAAIEEGCALYYAREADECVRTLDYAAAEAWVKKGLEQYPQHPLLALSLCILPFRRGDHATSKDRAVSYLQRPELPPTYRVQAGDLMATVILLEYRTAAGSGAPAALVTAERYCAEALENAKNLPPALGLECRATRGCIWIEQGRLEDGETELREVLPELTSPSSRAICLSYLALSEGRKGDAEASRRLLAEARKANPDSTVPLTVERDLAPLLPHLAADATASA